MSAFNPPYVRRTAASSSGGGVSPPLAASYYEPMMTMQGEYMVMMDGDIVMAEILAPYLLHNEIDTVVDVPPGTEIYYYEGEDTPSDPDVGDRWYKPSDGVIYTYILDGGLLVWADL
jgi:hypothetical protein